VERDEREGHGIPSLEHEALMDKVCTFATWQDAASIACLADGSFDEWAEIAAATEFILNAKSARITQIPRPLRVDFSFEVECTPPVCHVARNDEKTKAYPEKECVDAEERAIVEENTGPTDKGRCDAKYGCEGGDDKFGPVADSDDVGVSPYVEPSQQTEDSGNKRVYRELH
jgi:hypothetical protein